MADRVKHLFVYGTLMQGQANHDHFCADALTIEPAVSAGRLYHLPMGYPALVEADNGHVVGEAMTFTDLAAKLVALDHLEGYRPNQPEQSLYLRRIRPISVLKSGLTVPAYCYIWRGKMPSGSILAAPGRWPPERES